MKLNHTLTAQSDAWQSKCYHLPQYNRDKIMERTKSDPFWIHFGIGNIFRAFHANAVQTLLNQGILDRGLTAAEGFDYELVEKVSRPHDDYSILATLKSNGTIEKTVVGSIMETLLLDSESETEFSRLKEIFSNPSLQIASFTITEKGYSLKSASGTLHPHIAADMERGPEKPQSYIGKVAALLYVRYLANQLPLAMVSMDNCSHNGDRLYEAVRAYSEAWVNAGLADSGFLNYIQNPQKVSFPWTMIDKITPRPDASVAEILKNDDVEDISPVITNMCTYAAPFVNAEECEYLVIEDTFPNGRPELEQAGFLFTSRETVEKVERMKVCTCLNPLHTALAVFGCLLGYEKISEEMKDESLQKLVEGIGYKEGIPVVTDPGILNPKDFIDTVLKVRIPNPFLPDTPQRIATDTSQKMAIRFGETIKAYQHSDSLDVHDLTLIPLVFAGWLRYLTGTDDTGTHFELSPDPMLEELKFIAEAFQTGMPQETEALLRPLLENESIFGVNLYQAGLAPQVIRYFTEMMDGNGAVRRTLEKYV